MQKKYKVKGKGKKMQYEIGSGILPQSSRDRVSPESSRFDSFNYGLGTKFKTIQTAEKRQTIQSSAHNCNSSAAKTSPSTDDSRDNLQPHEILDSISYQTHGTDVSECLGHGREQPRSKQFSRTRASSDNPLANMGVENTIIDGPSKNSTAMSTSKFTQAVINDTGHDVVSSSGFNNSRKFISTQQDTSRPPAVLDSNKQGTRLSKQSVQQAKVSSGSGSTRQNVAAVGSTRKKKADSKLENDTFSSEASEQLNMITTPYVHKWRTQLCKAWAKGDKCAYGDACSFAHGSQQLMKGQQVSQPAYNPSSDNQNQEKVANSVNPSVKNIITKCTSRPDDEEKKSVSSSDEADSFGSLHVQASAVKPNFENTDSVVAQYQKANTLPETVNRLTRETSNSISAKKLDKTNDHLRFKSFYRLLVNETLDLRKAWSEAPGQKDPIQDMITDDIVCDQELLDLTELKQVKRLSCFEQICPHPETESEQDNYVISLEQHLKDLTHSHVGQLSLEKQSSTQQIASLPPLKLDIRTFSTPNFGQHHPSELQVQASQKMNPQKNFLNKKDEMCKQADEEAKDKGYKSSSPISGESTVGSHIGEFGKKNMSSDSNSPTDQEMQFDQSKSLYPKKKANGRRGCRKLEVVSKTDK